MIGIAKGSVHLCPYSTEWSRFFEEEKTNLYNCIGDYIIDIQHIGSTSIQGMHSKPVIDILIGIEHLNDGFKLIKSIEEMGYHFKGSLGKSHRFFFWKGTEENNTHNLHIVEYGDENWENLLLFRDFLNENSSYKDQYSELKMELANDFKNDRETYTKRKNEFIIDTIQLARRKHKKG